MNRVVSNAKKKDFLRWFTKNYKLKARESLWILDFLYSHASMLEKSHFVENVDQTPRGIYMSVTGMEEPDFVFYKNGHAYNDPMKAFHEVRLNWSSDLFVELGFENAWQYPQYLGVLEDNPYASWNDQVSEEDIAEMNWALTYASLEIERQALLDKVDELLSIGDKENFERLSKDLEIIENKIEEVSSEW